MGKLTRAEMDDAIARETQLDNEELTVTIFMPEGIPENFEVMRDGGESDESYQDRKALIEALIKVAATSRSCTGE